MAQHRQPDDPLAGLLRHGLKQAAAPECVSPDLLGAYFERSLTSVESAQIESHVSSCSHCQQQLAALARIETAVGVPAQVETAGRGFWFLNWRWLTPVTAAAVATFAIWVAVQPQAPVSLGDKPQIAAAREPAPAAQSPAPPPASRSFEQNKNAASKDGDSLAFRRQNLPTPSDRPAATGGLVGRSQGPAVVAPTPATASTLVAEATEPNAATKLADEKKKEAVAAVEELDAAGRRADLAAPAEKRVESAKLAATQKPEMAGGEKAQERELQKSQIPPQAPAPAAAQQAYTQSKAQPVQSELVIVDNAAKPEVSRDRAQEAPPKQTEEGFAKARKSFVQRPEFTALGGRIQWRFYKDRQIERHDERLKSGDFVSSPVTQELLAASAPSEKVCWAVGRGGVVIRTVSGEPWKQIGSPTEEDLVFIEARDEQNATVRTRSGKTYATSDGGRTWRSS